MTCCRMDEMMMKHFDGELNDIDSYRFKQHLKACPACSQQYGIIAEVIGYIEEEPLMEPSEDFEDRVMQSIREQASKKDIFDPGYIRNPVFVICAVLCSILLSISAFFTILLQGVSVMDIFNVILHKGDLYAVMNNFITAWQNGFKVIVLMGDSLFGAYYVLLKNYYDIILSIASGLVIIYTMSIRVAKHN